jgi:hypothetical protein
VAKVIAVDDGHVAEVLMTENDRAFKEEIPFALLTEQELEAIIKDDNVKLLEGVVNLGEGMFTCDVYIAHNIIVNMVLSQHNANLHSFPVEQAKRNETEQAISIDAVLQDYMYMCEEAYLSGSLDLTFEPLVITDESSSPSSLHLCSIGLMKVDNIHKLPSHRILKVLFDTGSDKNLINKHALPKQAIQIHWPSCITGLHGSKPLDRFG